MSLHVVLGVTGSIAAYKAVEVARLLRKSGARVQAMLTEGAVRFVTPLTFEAITGRPVRGSVWSMSGDHERKIEHVEDAYIADRVLVAPATAQFLARYAHGWADDALTATLLSTTAPVMVAPAMETNMWNHPATRANVETLRRRGVSFLGPESGALASGRSGDGRMWAPERIVDAVLASLPTSNLAAPGATLGADYVGLKVLLTAGPTWEPLDPVRILTNRSTGAMGLALAAAAARRGADVRLVLGPTHLQPASSVVVERVETAEQMLSAARAAVDDVDVFIATAAVSDFRIAAPRGRKLKRSDPAASTLALSENPDILATLSGHLRQTRPGATVVGYAAETEDVVTNARAKLARKGCDLVIANRVGPESGFGPGKTEVAAVRAQGEAATFGPATKAEVAEFVLDQVLDVRRERKG